MTDDELMEADAFRDSDNCEGANVRSRGLKDWAMSLFCWDGLLPLAVISLPNFLELLLPRWDFGLALASVALPVIALSIRFIIGWVMMRRSESYIGQMVLFTVAISALFLFEAFLLNDQIGNGPKIANPTVLIGMFATYFVMMSIALFPLRTHFDN